MRETGCIAPTKFGDHRKYALDVQRDLTLNQIDEVPHLTLHRLKDLLTAHFIVISIRYEKQHFELKVFTNLSQILLASMRRMARICAVLCHPSEASATAMTLAETIDGLWKAEVIYRRGPWRGHGSKEFATLEWVDGFENRRLLESMGNVPPAEAEAANFASLEKLKTGA